MHSTDYGSLIIIYSTRSIRFRGRNIIKSSWSCITIAFIRMDSGQRYMGMNKSTIIVSPIVLDFYTSSTPAKLKIIY